MQLQQKKRSDISTDIEQIMEHLPIDEKRVLELGCGRAEVAIALADRFPSAEIVATEVDREQLDKLVALPCPSNLTFRYGGAEKIESPDASMDVVMMIKSLHHVPIELMDESLQEIHRVLKPGGLAYISEPVYAGDFNEILRLFRDEQVVRLEAFAALRRAVKTRRFRLVKQIFFETVRRFRGFEEFDARVLSASHSPMITDKHLRDLVELEFLRYLGEDGVAEFRSPQRADLLVRES